MKGKIVLGYEWWNTQNPKAEIKENHREALKETAEDRIAEMVSQGYTSGELMDNIHFDESDGDDGIEYRGSWSMRSETGSGE